MSNRAPEKTNKSKGGEILPAALGVPICRFSRLDSCIVALVGSTT